MIDIRQSWTVRVAVLGGVLLAAVTAVAAAEEPLTFLDLMQFRQIEDAVISNDGNWIAYALQPDRGDGEVVARLTTSGLEYRIERGAGPEISADGRWVAATISPTLEEREKSKNKKKEKGKKGSGDEEPKNGLSILALQGGEETRIDEVESFAFSADGRWLAYRMVEREEEPAEEGIEVEPGEPVEGEPGEANPDEDDEEEDLGTDLTLLELATGDEIVIEHVRDFAFAENNMILAVSVAAPEGEGNRVVLRDLRGETPAIRVLHTATHGRYTSITWAEDVDHVAFVAAVDDEDGEPGDAEVWVSVGGGEARKVASRDDAPGGFTVPSTNEVAWSRDGQRLFFGFKLVDSNSDSDSDSDGDGEDKTEETPFDPYDLDAVLEDRGLDVWHWMDPRIVTDQKERWEEHEKDRVRRAVVHLDDGQVVALADEDLPMVLPSDNPRIALGVADVPYLREITWEGRFADLYAVDLRSGERTRVASKLAGGWRSPTASLSPNGGHVLYYQRGDWHLFDTATGETRNLTMGLGVPFANEDWDYAADTPGYDHSEWLADSSAVMIYDKYDIWRVPSAAGDPTCVTAGRGREAKLIFRVVDLDPESETIEPGEALLLSAYDDIEKHDALFTLDGAGELRKLVGDGNHRLKVLTKAEEADRLLFTRERYEEFPDLWVASSGFAKAVRLSDANPQIGDFAWGSAELVEWTSADGIPLQGVLIKPGNYEPGKRYPVLVYYYRFFSQRLNLFNEPVVNHRPSFPLYASNGYAVFLPDIRFEVGRPGFSATKCLVPGVQKLVDMGIADPDAIGLHGHSWSGYQTAFVITQTDIFAAAVAGAPVSNMTSAYSGIRWGTGLARQFQYEKSQSRIGASLWESPHLYIENSPVFFADRINTPLLIQFGDEDGAVPWTQGIELYLACRRLDKDCIMLQYRGEPHHLKQYPNKLDYSIKMKQFFDHHLKGEEAPEWMTEGASYRGK